MQPCNAFTLSAIRKCENPLCNAQTGFFFFGAVALLIMTRGCEKYADHSLNTTSDTIWEAWFHLISGLITRGRKKIRNVRRPMSVWPEMSKNNTAQPSGPRINNMWQPRWAGPRPDILRPWHEQNQLLFQSCTLTSCPHSKLNTLMFHFQHLPSRFSWTDWAHSICTAHIVDGSMSVILIAWIMLSGYSAAQTVLWLARGLNGARLSPVAG